MNALALTTYENEVTDPGILSSWTNLLYSPGYQNLQFTTQEQTNASIQKVNQLLDKTALKKACCLGSTSINVRIPVPEDVVFDNTPPAIIAKQYGYYDVPVTITPEMCNELVPGFNTNNGYAKCDDFFQTYCDNMIDEFKKLNNGNFDYETFSIFKPECICFMPKPSWITQSAPNVSSKCIFPGCGDYSGTWVDKQSRTGDCNETICNVNFNISNITAEEYASIISKITQNCGNVQPEPGPGPNPPTPEPSNNTIGTLIALTSSSCFILCIFVSLLFIISFFI